MDYEKILEQQQAKEEAILDAIDLKSYLAREKYISDIMYEIEEDFGEKYDIFYYMSEVDFLAYLRKRYPNFKYKEIFEYQITNI